MESSRVVVQKLGPDVMHTSSGTVVAPSGSFVLSVESQWRSHGTSGQCVAVESFRLDAEQSVNVEVVWHRWARPKSTSAAGVRPACSSASVYPYESSVSAP